jgi:hypothetical protein
MQVVSWSAPVEYPLADRGLEGRGPKERVYGGGCTRGLGEGVGATIPKTQADEKLAARAIHGRSSATALRNSEVKSALRVRCS